MIHIVCPDYVGNWYTYGPFDSRILACQWAEKNLSGFDWHCALHIPNRITRNDNHST